MRAIIGSILVTHLLISGPAWADRAAAHYHQAMAHKKQGKIAEAIAALKQAIALRDDYAAAHWSIGILYRQRNDYGRAVLHLERAAVLQPKSAEAHFSLGLAYHHQGERKKAILALERASALEPANGPMRAQLGSLLIRSDPGRAIAQLKEAVRLMPKDARSLHQLGLAYRQASSRSPNARDERTRREYLHHAQRHMEQALALGESPELHFDLGVLYRRLDKGPKSIEHYERAVQMNPKLSAAWWDLGHMYAKSQRDEEAIAAYQQYVTLKGDGDDVAIAKKRIAEIKGAPSTTKKTPR